MNEVLSSFAIVVSVAAALFAWYSAYQAKRQADAVLGEVPPSFSFYQVRDEGRDYPAQVAAEVINHNRRPMYVENWNFDVPEGYRIHQAHKNEKDRLAALYDAVFEGKTDFAFAQPLRLGGNNERTPAPELAAVFNVSVNGKPPAEATTIGMSITFRLEGDDHPTTVSRSVTWVPKG